MGGSLCSAWHHTGGGGAGLACPPSPWWHRRPPAKGTGGHTWTTARPSPACPAPRTAVASVSRESSASMEVSTSRAASAFPSTVTAAGAPDFSSCPPRRLACRGWDGRASPPPAPRPARPTHCRRRPRDVRRGGHQKGSVSGPVRGAGGAGARRANIPRPAATRSREFPPQVAEPTVSSRGGGRPRSPAFSPPPNAPHLHAAAGPPWHATAAAPTALAKPLSPPAVATPATADVTCAQPTL